MEHFKSPYETCDLTSTAIVANQTFFDDMLRRSRTHRYYSHPFMVAVDELTPSPDAVRFVLTSIYKMVRPFTALLCALGGRAPDLRSRFALMDNIYEEMGRGDITQAHPNLYLRMLASIGVSEIAAENERTLPTIRVLNEHLQEVVTWRNFAVSCSLLASAEAVIPPLFPVLARMAYKTFPDIDRTFFERHGPRDEGHSDDAAMLFAVSATPSDYDTAIAEIGLDLDHRLEILDEWMSTLQRGTYGWSDVTDRPTSNARSARRGSVRPSRSPSARPPVHRPSVPPPG